MPEKAKAGHRSDRAIARPEREPTSGGCHRKRCPCPAEPAGTLDDDSHRTDGRTRRSRRLVQHRLARRRTQRTPAAGADLSGQSERRARAGKEPAKAPRSIAFREASGDPQGDPDQSRQENAGHRRRGVPRTVEPSRDVSERPEPQGLSAQSGAAGLHPQSRRQAAALGHTDDAGSGDAGARQTGAGAGMGASLRGEQLRFPARTLHHGRDRGDLPVAVAERQQPMGARRRHRQVFRSNRSRGAARPSAWVHHDDPALAQGRRG